MYGSDGFDEAINGFDKREPPIDSRRLLDLVLG
jgi:hypothetical protein